MPRVFQYFLGENADVRLVFHINTQAKVFPSLSRYYYLTETGKSRPESRRLTKEGLWSCLSLKLSDSGNRPSPLESRVDAAMRSHSV